MTNPEIVENYEHNHVLRTILHDDLLSETIEYSAGSILNKSISVDLLTLQQTNMDYSNTLLFGNGNSGGWNKNNMLIVAYIYKTDNSNEAYEIVQVEEIHFLTSAILH